MRMLSILIFLTSALVFASSQGFGPGVQQYGYADIREGAHIFWWLHHTTANVSEASDRPLIVFLMGGPGLSSCGGGNFFYVGPIDEYMTPRETTWVKDYNILFIDSPVGAGFSYVDDFTHMATKDIEIAQDLVATMKSFYEKAPKFIRSPLYIYGISYGGKTAAHFSQLLSEEIKAGTMEVDFRGVAMAGPAISSIDSALAFGRTLYEMGFVDKDGMRQMDDQAALLKETFDRGEHEQARAEWAAALDLAFEVTDGANIYYLLEKAQQWERANPSHQRTSLKEIDFYDFMNGPVKEALSIPEHVSFGSQLNQLQERLYAEYMKPAMHIVERLLNETDVQVYVCSGNFDLITNTPGAIDWINKLRWPGYLTYSDAPRRTLWINDTMEGYYKEAAGFHFYWINVAGHTALFENEPAHRAFMRSLTGL